MNKEEIIQEIKKRIDLYSYLISITKNKNSLEQLKMIKQEFVVLLQYIRNKEIEKLERNFKNV